MKAHDHALEPGHQEPTLSRQGRGFLVYALCSIVGLTMGLLSSFIFSATEYVSDLKQGYCRTHPWLSKRLCCLITPLETCAWTSWGEDFRGFLMYTLVAACSAGFSVWLVLKFNRLAAGSGIPEVKTILGGSDLPGLLSFQTLVIKVLGLIFSVGSGLAVGTQGPLVHIACCVSAIVVDRFQGVLHENLSMVILSAGAAAGVSVAFGAPIGGVLYSLEESSNRYPHKTMWCSFVCASIAAFTVLAIDSMHIGKFVIFEVILPASYGEDWAWCEMVAFTILGLAGGAVGGLFVKLNVQHCIFRSKSFLSSVPFLEIIVLSLLTSTLNFGLPCTRGSTTSMLSEMFEPQSRDTSNFCPSAILPAGIAALVYAFVVHLVLMIVTFGATVPSGLFTPSLTLGALLGHLLAAACKPLLGRTATLGLAFALPLPSHINPTLYALVGAASVLCGVTRMTVSLVVIMFELTRAPNCMLPIMWGVVCARCISGHITQSGIFDEYIKLRGYLFLNSTIPLQPEACAVDVMCSHGFTVIDVDANNTVGSLTEMLNRTQHPGFPVVSTTGGGEAVMLCHGYITRDRLSAAVAKAKRKKLSPPTICFFSSAERVPKARIDSVAHFDLSSFLDAAPMQVVQHTPLTHIVDLFTQLDLSYCLVTHQGSLIGLIHKKDLVANLETHSTRKVVDVRSTDWT